jgi:RNA polymerase sigma-70 factor (ECF subfamily)
LGKYSDLTDLVLLEKVLGKDPRALEELYDRYSTILFTLIKKIVPDNKAAEFILVEVFAIVWRKVKSFNFKTGDVYTWLIYLGRNRAIDSLKRNRTSAEKPDNYSDEYEDLFIIPYLDERIDALDLNTAFKIKPQMEAALDKLTDAQKYVLHLSFYEGYTLNEIAQKLNIPIEAVREKVTMAAHSLRDNLIGG